MFQGFNIESVWFAIALSGRAENRQSDSSSSTQSPTSPLFLPSFFSRSEILHYALFNLYLCPCLHQYCARCAHREFRGRCRLSFSKDEAPTSLMLVYAELKATVCPSAASLKFPGSLVAFLAFRRQKGHHC